MEFQLRLKEPRAFTRQIYDQIRAAILEGRLRRGSRLLSTRDLADQLSVARKTVVVAYDMLLAEGLIVARPGAGTYVEDLRHMAPGALGTPSPLRVGPRWQDLPALPGFPREPVKWDFGVGVPDLSHFPWALWRTLSARHLRLATESDRSYLNPQGYRLVREAIARYVGFSRAVLATPDEVLVTSGAQQALQLIAQVMLQPGAVVAMESPGYPLAHSAFQTQGAKIVEVPVDREGLLVTHLPKNTRLVYTTPSHQFPTGVVMSYERRVRLLEWARARGVAIIEDDYDSEFRFEGRPLEALQSLDPSCVIYVGTFSKSLFPGVRLGFAVAPPPLRAALLTAKQLSDWHTPLLAQAVVAEFISEGHYLRHIRRMRRLYADRRTRLITEVQRSLGDYLEIVPSGTGLHFSATLTQDLEPDRIANDALGVGVRVFPMPGGLMFGLGPIDAALIKDGTEKLKAVFKASRRRTTGKPKRALAGSRSRTRHS